MSTNGNCEKCIYILCIKGKKQKNLMTFEDFKLIEYEKELKYNTKLKILHEYYRISSHSGNKPLTLEDLT